MDCNHGFFEECLFFFRKHYSVVGFPQVLENYQGGASLPDNPLLITFDDGWKCNLQNAAPMLGKVGFPAMLFVTTGATGKPILSWQEALFAGRNHPRQYFSQHQQLDPGSGHFPVIAV